MKKIGSLFVASAFVLLIFVSVPAASNHLKFAVISDVEGQAALEKALEFISAQSVDFIILAGDFYHDLRIYSEYGFNVDPQLNGDKQSLYLVLGNHDQPPVGTPDFQQLVAPYYPGNGPAGAPIGTIYSFDRGECHFVITNQYWQCPEGGYIPEQLEWIQQDLFSSPRPFKFVIGHEPAFPIERHIGDSLDMDPDMRDRFWSILSGNNVQAFFCGHIHYLTNFLI